MLVIAVDYDDTYDAIPELMEPFMQAAKKAGHVCVIVTARNPEKHKLTGLNHEVIYCDGKPKAEVMRSLGMNVDIWIDDWPELIGPTRG